jgi:hypothetical protein
MLVTLAKFMNVHLPLRNTKNEQERAASDAAIKRECAAVVAPIW